MTGIQKIGIENTSFFLKKYNRIKLGQIVSYIKLLPLRIYFSEFVSIQKKKKLLGILLILAWIEPETSCVHQSKLNSNEGQSMDFIVYPPIIQQFTYNDSHSCYTTHNSHGTSEKQWHN